MDAVCTVRVGPLPDGGSLITVTTDTGRAATDRPRSVASPADAVRAVSDFLAVAASPRPPTVAVPAERGSTAREVDRALRHLEEVLDSVGDDAQLASLDLQNALQRQQQLLQMLSTISRLLGDTAMAVIRKIGG
jgi:hypothetical protein